MNKLNLYNKNFINAYLKQNKIELRKNLGQNFVIDKNLIDTLLSTADLTIHDTVIEIGAGMGSLTAELLKTGARVIAVEIDNRLIELLKHHFGHDPNFVLIEGDILRKNTMDKLKQYLPADRSIKVVANVPYYITSPILTLLLSSDIFFSDIIITIQKEVAQRITASAGTKKYSAISVFINYYGYARIIETFSPASFFPNPKVFSSILRIKIYDKKPVVSNHPKYFHYFVKLCFTERRKMIKNSILNILKSWNVDKNGFDYKNCFEKLSIDTAARPETFNVKQFIGLADAFRTVCPSNIKKKYD